MSKYLENILRELHRPNANRVDDLAIKRYLHPICGIYSSFLKGKFARRGEVLTWSAKGPDAHEYLLVFVLIPSVTRSLVHEDHQEHSHLSRPSQYCLDCASTISLDRY